MKLKVTKPVDGLNLYHFDFGDSVVNAMAFCRLQEFYESPKFKGKYFEMPEFAQWYAKNQSPTKTFSYYTDWAGFNFPSSNFLAWDSGYKLANDFEREAVEKLEDLSHSLEDFYVISCTGESGAMEHEVAHAKFFLDETYKKNVMAILKKFKNKALRAKLAKMGYNKSVIDDEVHAYCITAEFPYGYAPSKEDCLLSKELQKLK